MLVCGRLGGVWKSEVWKAGSLDIQMCWYAVGWGESGILDGWESGILDGWKSEVRKSGRLKSGHPDVLLSSHPLLEIPQRDPTGNNYIILQDMIIKWLNSFANHSSQHVGFVTRSSQKQILSWML